MRTERVTILASAPEKAAIAAKAQELGLSVGETLRLAFGSFRDGPVDDAFLNAFAADAEATLIEAEARIDAALASVEATLAEVRAGRRAIAA